jgi:2-polyprenyl-6-methoxyphenol hydroxylase-like FAD-dependent oxidoreductase
MVLPARLRWSSPQMGSTRSFERQRLDRDAKRTALAPPLALGGAMAIEDAVVLAEELANTDDIGIAIPRFIARREPRVAFVQERTRITWARGRGEQSPGEPSDEEAFNRRNFAPLLEDP